MFEFNFAYEEKIDNEYLINGLRPGISSFDRFKNKTGEFASGFCAEPLMQLLSLSQVKYQKNLVENYIQTNEKFIYLIEILGSNPTWLSKAAYDDFSPWPSISQKTKDALVSGQATLVISHFKKQSDSKKSDPVSYELFKKLHQALDTHSIPAESVVYIGVSPELNLLYQNYILSSASEKKLKAVYSINYFEKGWQTYFTQYQKVDEIFSFENSLLNKNKIRKYKFLCFNREPRNHRKINLVWMHENNLMKDGLVSFYNEEDALRFDLENILKLNSKMNDLLEKFEKFESSLPLLVDAPKGLHISFCKKWPYADSYFTLLTERVFDCQNSWTLLTAKVFKTMSNMHPFILIGQHNYLKSLHTLGYKTFSPHINESYDDISDPSQRLEAVWNEVNRLCSLTPDELHTWYYKLFPILEHNWRIFNKRFNESEYDIVIEKLKELINESN